MSAAAEHLWSGRWALGSTRQLLHALAVCFALVSHFILGFVVVAPMLGVGGDQVFGGSPASWVMTLIQGAWGWGLLLGLGMMVAGNVKLRELGWRSASPVRDVALGAAGALVLVVVVFGPYLVTGMMTVDELLTTVTGFSAGQRVQMFIIGVLAATSEETAFRGYLHLGLVTRLGFWPGLIIGSVLFGLYHAPMGVPVLGLVGKMVVGITLGLLRNRTRSLVAPMVAHFLFWQLAGFA